MNHVHVSLVTGITIACYLLIIGFFLRALAARYSETSFGKALASIY